ncbi:MAG: hypothetical protein FWC89_10610 [Defluviitaleaceae bacterium]|nr:hypothetical protein [Defluviitaleaceae bacterium]
MGLDARVPCNCFKLGKTTPPPIDRERIYVDEDGYLEIIFPTGTPKAEQDYQWRRIIEWEKNCCEHPDFDYCNERVGSWSSVRQFQNAAAKYPTLVSIFPDCNGGYVEAALIPQLLKELDSFCETLPTLTDLMLVNAKTGEKAYARSNVWEGGIFSMGGRTGVDIGFDENGLFVVSRDTGEEFFRSMHFMQSALPNEIAIAGDGREYTASPSTLTDIVTGTSYKAYLRMGKEDPAEFKIITRALSPEDFYTIAPLRKLFNASIETGNAIFWC